MHCAPFLLTMQIIFASVSYRRVVADLRGYIKGKKYTVDNAGATASISEASGSIQKSFEFNIFVNVEDAGSKKIKANVSISNDIGNKFIMVNASFKEE